MEVTFELPEITSKSLEYNEVLAKEVRDSKEKGLLYKEWRTGLCIPLFKVANDLKVEKFIVRSFENGKLKDSQWFEVLYHRYLQSNSNAYNEDEDFFSIENLAIDALSLLNVHKGKQQIIHSMCNKYLGYTC